MTEIMRLIGEAASCLCDAQCLAERGGVLPVDLRSSLTRLDREVSSLADALEALALEGPPTTTTEST